MPISMISLLHTIRRFAIDQLFCIRQSMSASQLDHNRMLTRKEMERQRQYIGNA